LLECGILGHGFLWLRCRECGHGKLLAFSCKRRGFLTDRGGSPPVLASVCVMKQAARCCTRRYNVVCSGRSRS
jgi:hypothetical protein